MPADDIQIVKLPLEEPSKGRLQRMAVVVGATLLVSAPGFIVMARDHHQRVTQAASFWELDGKPCAPLAEARFRDVWRKPSVTPYSGAVYERHGGAMTCTHRTETIGGAPVRYPVCKFSSPDYLAVTAGGQTRFYDLTMGRAAAIQVVNGEVRCAVAPKFEM